MACRAWPWPSSLWSSPGNHARPGGTAAADLLRRRVGRSSVCNGCSCSPPIHRDDDEARKYLESVRWPDGPACPHSAP
ncbi:MAG: transposase [Steroidobacteraceae bacterium]|nr:transposase [Steroidobacteraceae bacterium]